MFLFLQKIESSPLRRSEVMPSIEINRIKCKNEWNFVLFCLS